ncbi:PREDICTED: trypsin-like [Priapulus caudatus]|uniref:Trypsin-like n=1 Tax=Priapulus caudatus TaxID=37621 RepID=A0ABM1E470_PRICU|nr:PREDICTED: trypsin-like [Priapulus caudatus]
MRLYISFLLGVLVALQLWDTINGRRLPVRNHDFSHYIVGGTVVGAGARPYQVGLIRSGEMGEPFCGGSLIAADWVSSIVVHEDYRSANDIALVKLAEPAVLGPNVGLVQLAALDKTNVDALMGETCVVSGWGTTSYGGRQSDVLLEADVIGISQATCNAQYEYDGGIDAGMVCAAAPGKDSCQGDSGGPMVVVNDVGVPILEGVVSFGRGCAYPNYAGVYTRVSFYRDWVDSKIGSSP